MSRRDEDLENKLAEATTTQWNEVDGVYWPANPTVKELPPGFYKLIMTYSGLRIVRQEYTTVGIFPTGSPNATEILQDFNTFWKSGERFIKYKVPQRRGILLSGIPGSGKSCIVKLLADATVEQGGVIFDASQATDGVQQSIEWVHNLHSDMPVVIVMEDIDHYISYARQTLLQVMDGMNTVNKVMFIATTNNPETLGPALTNRCGRFDAHYKIMDAQVGVRANFIKTLIPSDELGSTPIDKWAEDTQGMPFGHIRELVIAVKVFNKDYTQTLERLRNMTQGQMETNLDLSFEDDPDDD